MSEKKDKVEVNDSNSALDEIKLISTQKDAQGQMLSMILKGKQNTLEDRLSDSGQKIADLIKDSQPVKDSYGNIVTSTGNDDIVEKFTNYTFTNDTLNYPLWLALYNDSWVFRRAIDKPAQDEIRCGITLQGEFDAKEKVYKLLKKARFDLIQLLKWGALFGGSIACVMIDGIEDKEYAEPLNKQKLIDSKVIRYYVVDRWFGVQPSTETVTDMTSLDFGKPKYYDVTFPDGTTIKFHHDYVLRYEHRTAPKLIKTGQLQGWGYAEGSHILNELSRDDKLKTSIQSLIDKSLIEVIKMSGMRGVFMGTDKGSEQQLTKRLEMVNWGRTFNSLTFLDKEDDYNMNTFSGISGLSDILEKNMWQISAALEMQGILFGDLKSGFANDTEALERYDETINGRCEDYVRPVYEKLLHILFIKLGIKQPIEFVFNSLLTKQVNEKRMNNLSQFVTLGQQLLDSGVINTKQFAKAIVSYSKNDTIDFDLKEEDINKLDDDFETQMENLKIDEPQTIKTGGI